MRFLIIQFVRHLPFLIGAAIVIALVIQNATLVEDAFISFRVVDNAAHGFGLRWNIFERVQVFTNPLWTLIHIPIYMLWPDIALITICLSIMCTAGAIWLVALSSDNDWKSYLCLFIAPLAVSFCFIQHSVTGLENPLNNLLFAACGWALLKAPEKRRWFYIYFFASLSMVSRLDTMFFYVPMLLVLGIHDIRRVRYGQAMCGAMPIVAWLSFSIVYYGFFFPNTKYAKLPENIAAWDYIQHGLSYLGNLFARDFSSGYLLAFAALVVPMLKLCRRIPVSPQIIAVCAGLLCYTIFVIRIGGDHITGRFWSLHIFIAAWVLLMSMKHILRWDSKLLVALLCVGLRMYYPSAQMMEEWYPPSVSGAIFPSAMIKASLNDYRANPKKFRAVNRGSSGRLNIWGTIGFYGYHSGPYNRIIDYWGLADPLLARMPTTLQQVGRIGHMPRSIPAGYKYVVRTGNTRYMPANLATYYNKLAILTQAPLWSMQRFQEILRFQRGYYDYLLH